MWSRTREKVPVPTGRPLAVYGISDLSDVFKATPRLTLEPSRGRRETSRGARTTARLTGRNCFNGRFKPGRLFLEPGNTCCHSFLPPVIFVFSTTKSPPLASDSNSENMGWCGRQRYKSILCADTLSIFLPIHVETFDIPTRCTVDTKFKRKIIRVIFLVDPSI